MVAVALWLVLGAPALLAVPQAEAKGIKVVGLGPGRTGTQSLRKALELLGYKVFGDLESVWNQTIRDARAVLSNEGKIEPLLEHLEAGGYNATAGLDELALSIWKAVGDASDAKAILTVRSPESYYKSIWRHNFWEARFAASKFGRQLWADYCPRHDDSYLQNMLWEPIYSDCSYCVYWHTSEQRDRCYQRYMARNQNVLLRVRQDRLLEFNVEDGWGPLCDFLGVPVPGVPFPTSDSTLLDSWAFKRWLVWFAAEHILLFGVWFALPCYLLFRCLRRYQELCAGEDEQHNKGD